MNRGPKLVKLRCESCRKDNKKCEDTRPCKYCLEDGVECVNATRKGRGHGTRVMAVSCFLSSINAYRIKLLLRRARIADGIKFDAMEPGMSASCLQPHYIIRIDRKLRPCAACARKGYECQDRACRACWHKGQEAACTHRNNQAGGTPDPEGKHSPLFATTSCHLMSFSFSFSS